MPKKRSRPKFFINEILGCYWKGKNSAGKYYRSKCLDIRHSKKYGYEYFIHYIKSSTLFDEWVVKRKLAKWCLEESLKKEFDNQKGYTFPKYDDLMKSQEEALKAGILLLEKPRKKQKKEQSLGEEIADSKPKPKKTAETNDGLDSIPVVVDNPATENHEEVIMTPANEVNNPGIQVNDHGIQTSDPDTQVNDPDVQMSDLVLQGNNPDIQGNNPDVQMSDPDIQVNNPDIQGNNPDIQVNDPDIQGNNPDIQGNNPDIQVNDHGIQVNDYDIQVNDPDIQVYPGIANLFFPTVNFCCRIPKCLAFWYMEDSDNIQYMKKVTLLPAKKTVVNIIDEYVRHVDFTDLCMYRTFDCILHDIFHTFNLFFEGNILYQQEMKQYKSFFQTQPSKTLPVEVYGGPHLLRHMFYFMSIYDEQYKPQLEPEARLAFVRIFQGLIDYLADHKEIVFQEGFYMDNTLL